MFYLYILQSLSNGKYYIGQTQNLEERINRHNTGQSKYTKGKGPWKLVYNCECGSRNDALALEKKLKNKKSRKYLERIIKAEGIPIAIGT